MSNFQTNTTYRITECPLTGDIAWNINDTDLAVTDGGYSLMKNFITLNKYPNYSLSIVDALTGQTIEIDCEIEKVPKIVSYIYNLEQAAPMSFIEIDSLNELYVVGMRLTKGYMEFGHYKDVDGRLVLQP